MYACVYLPILVPMYTHLLQGRSIAYTMVIGQLSYNNIFRARERI